MAKIHLGIGHYGIGFRDGVNTVIARNVRALSAIDPDMRITLFGKLAPDHEDFLKRGIVTHGQVAGDVLYGYLGSDGQSPCFEAPVNDGRVSLQ